MGRSADPLYERLGQSYSRTRVGDRRIAAQIEAALGTPGRVVNVGAGTGSYEPQGWDVVAVEPSPTMIRQRPAGAAPVVQATAEALPLASGSFDAALVVLAMHHWADVPRGLRELRRVADRQVVLFFEPLQWAEYWLLDYFPEIADLPTERHAPGADQIAQVLDLTEVQRVMVPRDCTDGFAAAYWARPEAYLDPAVRAGISSLALLSDAADDAGVRRLRADLESGAWEDRYGHLRSLDELDGGYRLAICQR
jgi:SAM-dependent methyltransferase